MYRVLNVLAMLTALALPVHADGILYQYEGDVLPYDQSAGWIIADPCEQPNCTQSLRDGYLILEWLTGNLVNYHYWLAQPPDEPPPTPFWIEWRFRSSTPKPLTSSGCDAGFAVAYRKARDAVDMYGDAVESFEGGSFLLGLEIDEFHTHRFETLDGVHYAFAVDGQVFFDGTGLTWGDYHYLQFSGEGGCDPKVTPEVNEWDYIRWGSFTDGESIISSDPPDGFLDPDRYAGIDRFTITFDQPNFVYLDDITVEVSAGDIPAISKTWRRDDFSPNKLEVVLDRPMTVGETTRFIFNTAAEGANIVEYTLAEPVPASSDWTILVTVLFLLTAATLVVRQRTLPSTGLAP